METVDQQKEETKVAASKTTAKAGRNRTASSTGSARELRRQQQENLRLRSTGKVSHIVVDKKDTEQDEDEDHEESSKKVNRRIKFDDKDDEGSVEQPTEDISERQDKSDDLDQEDDDDDDELEEVKGTSAVDEEKKRRALERDAARVAVNRKKRKRRHKTLDMHDGVDSDDEDLDDEFFAQLDSERRRKDSAVVDKQPLPRPKGKRTVFEIEPAKDSALVEREPVSQDHDIEVVVLGKIRGRVDDYDHPSLTEVSKPLSETALLFSRSKLLDGSDVLSPKKQRQLTKEKKQGRGAKRQSQKEASVSTKVAGWKRSKKMNNRLWIAAGNSKKQRRKTGVAPAHFVVRHSDKSAS